MLRDDAIRRDFQLVSSAWSSARAQAAIRTPKEPFIVVRRTSESGPTYHLFSRAEFATALAALGEVETIDALAAKPPLPVLILPGSAPTVTTPHVVLNRSGLVGITGLPKRKVAFGMRTESVSRSASPVTNYLETKFPPETAVGRTFSLLVTLAVTERQGRAAISAPAGTPITLIVDALDGVSVVGDSEQTVVMSDGPGPQHTRFQLRADAAGTGTFRLLAFDRGTSLAALDLTITIVDASDPAKSNALPSNGSQVRIEIGGGPPPDLSLVITESKDELTYRLYSADGELNGAKFGPVQLRTNPLQYFRGLFDGIERLPVSTVDERREAKRRLEAKGVDLFTKVMPPELQQRLWSMRDRIARVHVTSDEPWIPWEMCRLSGVTDGRVEEGPFFAELCMTRWVQGVPAARVVSLSKMALVVPGTSGLPSAVDEHAYVLSLADTKHTVTEVAATYLGLTEAMAMGEFDAWHFTGHARRSATLDADEAAIELEDGDRLTAADIAGRTENLLVPRPFIVLNACQSAAGGLSLTDAGGWARRFLRADLSRRSASAFIGTHWSVTDDLACTFAKGLYQGLREGKTVGEAAQVARAAIRSTDDPTWLAYTVYADPNAVLRRA